LSKKEKLLVSAQKSLQEGNLNKALKEYQKLVELDPKDIRNRQKLGELYNRAKMADQAIDEFQIVGRYYAENGFHLKAIAVYKQIQKINPNRPDVYNLLADLNVKQGLVGNALAEYRSLVAFYEQQNNTAKIIDTLQKMKEVDPENLNIRVKLSEMYAKDGLQDDALAELRETMGILQAKREPAKILKLHDMFPTLFLSDSALKIGLATVFIQQGEEEKGISLLQEVLQQEPDNWSALRALAGGYRKLGKHDPEQKIYARLVAAFPDDLDLLELQVQALMDGGAFEPALNLLEKSKAAFFAEDRVPALKIYYKSLSSRLPNDERIAATLSSVDDLLKADEEFFDRFDDAPASKASRGTGVEALVPEIDDLELESPEEKPAGLPPVLLPPVEDEEEEIPLEFLEEEIGNTVDEPESTGADVELALECDEMVFSDIDTDVVAGEGREPLDEFVPDEDELSLSFDEEDGGAALADSEAGSGMTEFDFGSVDDLVVGIGGASPPEGPAEELLDFSTGDLAELEAALDISTPASKKKDRFGLEGEFSQFKKGVEAQIDADDAESHFNLGIAYREMGLINDAIGEFDQVTRNPSRRVDGLTLKGICLRDMGNFAQAEQTFKFGLELRELTESQRISFLYEMGLLYEAWDRLADALEHFCSVSEADGSFRNVRERIRDLEERSK